MDYYFDNISFKGEIMISAIKTMSESHGQGSEYVSCSFDQNDEDFKKGYVTLSFWSPAVDEDTMIFIKNEIFYEGLIERCKPLMEKKSEDSCKLALYLKSIKDDLNV